MNTYVTGLTIKNLREKKGLTQTELADILGVSSKAVSKWETAKGLPDISLIEPLANALSVSVMELMTGDTVINKNISSNILRSKFYVCPVCNNIIRTVFLLDGNANEILTEQKLHLSNTSLKCINASSTLSNNSSTVNQVVSQYSPSQYLWVAFVFVVSPFLTYCLMKFLSFNASLFPYNGAKS